MNTQLQTTFAQRLLASRLLDQAQLSTACAAVGEEESLLATYLVREGLLTRFQVRQLRAGPATFHVDKYVVVDCIGRGGSGVVYKARHTLLPQRYVALKTLDARNLHHSSEMLARFRREIDIVSRLDHPNVVRAYDVVRTRTQLYLVLEFIAGQDLGAVVRERGPLPIPEAVDYALQAAQGLAYAHRCGIIHRDLKPGNLLLTRDRVVKLSDLGLARFFVREPDAELTLKGMCLGTPEFMAPEQAEDAGRADARSDLYSLGATLFHLITGELPVTGSSQMQRLQRLLTEPPRPLAEARADVPAAVAAVVDRLRARDPNARPATAEEAIALLTPLARSEKAAGQPWDGPRKAALVLEVLQGKSSAVEACARYGLDLEEFEGWQQRFLEGGQQALDPKAGPCGTDPKRLRDLHAKIGAQAMEIESLKDACAFWESLCTSFPGAPEAKARAKSS
jgi:serine/threonine-protein kinase